MDFVYPFRKLRRQWHAIERIDVRPACISLLHQTDGSTHGRADDAYHLTEPLSDVTLTNVPEEHVPMRANMLNR